jgi:lipoprotein-releasing system ATP-binding protein
MSEAAPLIELRKVTKEYPGAPEPLRVLQEIDFRLDAGECVAVTGPSGCGKSTLLNLMGALDRATSGEVLFAGRDLAAISENEQARLRNRDIGFIFQLHHLLPQYTVLENVLTPVLAARNTPDAGDRALDLLARTGLADKADARPGQLSGGERQRVAVARALINRPRLLLADEPTGSLNEAGAERLADLLRDLQREEGMAVVIVTHASAIAARFDKILELHGGRLVSPE